MVDITRAVAEGRTDLEVREVMTRSFLTINSEEPIFEAIKMLGKTGARQLVVLDSGALWGIITSRNLIEALTPALPEPPRIYDQPLDYVSLVQDVNDVIMIPGQA
jgi:CBS domain-containing protein